MQALDLTTGKVAAAIKFETGVNEIFAIQVLPGIAFPEVLESDNPLVESTYALPPQALAQVRE